MAYANDRGHWVPRQKMLEFLDRLLHVRHPDYDTIREIKGMVEEFQDVDTVLAMIDEKSGFEYDDLDHVADHLKEREVVFDLVEAQENAAFGDDETPLGERLAAGLVDLEKREAAYWDIRTLCMDAGLIRPGDRDTDVFPLLRMFLPV